MSQKKRVRAVYGKPLLRGKNVPLEDPEALIKHILEEAGKKAVEAVKKEIRRSSWNRQPKDLLDSFSYEVRGNTMVLSSTHPAAQYLNKGVKPHQMIYLEQAKRPIPVITEGGKVVFRTPSGQTMRDGSWQHPGIKGKHFLDRGVEKAREAVKEEIVDTCMEALVRALRGDL